ncbi:MAG TPA: peptidylprolyl isomerase [Tenuifilaceae bacterium]|nr:peptidylprolyl isomerase [Tenuifilaceae bacterium]HPI45981.1 peptidylprolyl isomerase [Tenuifilaceae bacterium]HPN21892.1 peptidylprolyl isomerase [Tenuifilaceae bacterium]
MRFYRFLVILLVSISTTNGYLKSQNVIDQVVAVVGGERILLSDIEQEMLRMKMQGALTGNNDKCQLLEQMLTHKLLVNQSKIDSIEVNQASIESEIDRRLKYFIDQIGSEKALENYFNKPMYEIKDDLREVIEEQQLSQQMRQKIVDKVKITPSEVKSFYKNTLPDSLPKIPEQYELQQIMIFPPSSAEAKFQVKEKLLEIRERILKGERFSTLAVAYSEDRASAIRGGELGFRSRDELVKAFADVAFGLKEGQVSQIVETEYGFHIIQMIESKGDKVNVRHILMKPQFSSDMTAQAIAKLDSISTLIKSDSIKFEHAAMRFSEDKKSNLNGGLVINPYTNTSLFEKEHLQPSDFYVIRDLKVDEMSTPFESRDEHANVVFKIVKIKRIVKAHTANIKDDYDVIQGLAKQSMESDILKEWIEKKQRVTFIRIDPSFKNCTFESKGWIK